MKHLITILTMSFISAGLIMAQDDHKQSYATTDIEVINLDMEYGDMNVTFGDVDELQITHNITINGSYTSEMIDISKRERNGVLNIDYSFDFDEVEQRVTLIDEQGNKQILTSSEYNKIKNP